MKLRSGAFLILPALAFAGLAFAQAPRPGVKGKPAGKPIVRDNRGDKNKVDRSTVTEAIGKSAKVSRANYWRYAEAQRGAKMRKIAATPLVTKGTGNVALAASTKSTLTVVGGEGLPAGFGSGFTWDRAENEALLVLFINAADSMGVSIDGLVAGDEVQVLSASGVASFADGKGNPLATSLVGLVAAGAKVYKPEAAPAIDAAEKFAKEGFKAIASDKRRDAFGVDPGSGHKARQEGGLLVCLPEAGGTYYSGSFWNRDRYIKGNGVRTDNNIPAHVYGSFYPRQGETVHNTRKVRQSGQMFVLAWDHKFEDNTGFYKVFLTLRKGNGQPDIILRKQKK